MTVITLPGKINSNQSNFQPAPLSSLVLSHAPPSDDGYLTLPLKKWMVWWIEETWKIYIRLGIFIYLALEIGFPLISHTAYDVFLTSLPVGN